MAYQALYRTFRPTTLDGLVRQEHIVRILRNQIETGKVGHAYLFCGPRGTGKTSTAKIFAKAINCLHPINGSPCGECEVCKALADPSNLDISEIDAASNNGVDEMRELREKVQYPPVAARLKVCIIDEVHMLSVSAFNALLKTLEEPPAHAVFILATTEPQKLPATILSRCMRFDFNLIPQTDIEQHLKKVFDRVGKEYEDEAVAAIARAGEGSMRDSLSVADICLSCSKGKLTYTDVCQVLGTANFYEIAKLGECILTEQTAEAIDKTEQILSSGNGVGVLVKDILNFLNQCSVAKACRNGKELLGLPTEMYSEIARIAEQADARKLIRAAEIFAQAETDLRYSVSPRIIFETAVFKACLSQADTDVLTLSRRLSALEEQLRGGTVQMSASARPSVSQPIPSEVIAKSSHAPHFSEEEIPFPNEPMSEQTEIYSEPSPLASLFGNSAGGPSGSQTTTTVAKKHDALKERNKAFAWFIQSLRKNVKSGVLFTMCQDLETRFDGDTFILSTDNEVIYSRLNDKDNHECIARALEAIGITDFRITTCEEKEDPVDVGIEQLRKDFPDTEIEVK